MIQKIGSRVEFKAHNGVKKNENKQIANNRNVENPIASTPVDSALLNKYYVSFEGLFGSKDKNYKSDKLAFIEQGYTQEAEDLVDSATDIAIRHGHPEVGETHIHKAALESISSFLDDLDTGARRFSLDSSYQLPAFFSAVTSSDVFKEKAEREKIRPIINEELAQLDETLQKMPHTKLRTQPLLSKSIVNGVYDIITESSRQEKAELNSIAADDAMFLASTLNANQNSENNNLKKFIFKLNDALMSDSRTDKERIHLSIYDDKAKNILKNLSLGTNMFVLHDAGANPIYLADSVVEILKNPKAEFGSLNHNNTKVNIFNDNIKQDYLAEKIRNLSKDTSINHIIIAHHDNLLLNTAKTIEGPDGQLKTQVTLSEDLVELMKNQPKNVKIVLMQGKNGYYAIMADPVFKKTFEAFGEVPFATLNTEQTKQAFKEQPLLMAKLETPFSKRAVDKVIESVALLDGVYPQKAQKMLKKLDSYYLGKSEINEKDVKSYMEAAKESFKITGEGSSVDIVFDTGKKLDDVLGKSATKKEAEAIVKQIKKGILGTKGKMIYSQDGSVGSGRKFIAKAIAGETKSPYVELNAMDFGAQEINIFGGGALPPENAMKKAFSLLKTQAEASPHKSAVMLIENFEYLSFGDGFSPGYAKAMAQLSREMDYASKKGLNILVLGSVQDSYYAEACSDKVLKFIDKIEVESPSRNINARIQVLEATLKKKNVKIAGASEAEKKAVVKLMADTASGFPHVYLVNLVDKIKEVVMEKGDKQIKTNHVTEAYLQLTTGRPSSGPISDHRKAIVTSHECGHAYNVERMWSIAEKQNIPWHLAERVNFITLDPRGDFGGAMYSKSGGNEEYSFQKIFSDLVCDYGGHSAEKHFYNIDGSWGITCDIEMATHTAQTAVGIMGQGHNFGKKSLAGMMLNPSNRALQTFEYDTEVMLHNAVLTSDLITKSGSDFNKEFTNKYAWRVGTGDCLVQGDTFREEIADWMKKQSKETLTQMEEVDKTILNIIDSAKKGIKFNINGENVSKVVKDLYKSVAHNIR